MTVGRLLLGPALLLLPLEALAQSGQTIGWQEAVARLAAERTRAEACAAIFKRHGNDVARSQGELAYADARAEIDGVIAGLIAALAEGKEPASLPDLEARLKRGLEGRKAFCDQAARLAEVRPGEKNVLVDIATAAIGPLVEAVLTLVKDAREADQLTRKTIQTQLEATKWLDFGAVSPRSA